MRGAALLNAIVAALFEEISDDPRYVEADSGHVRMARQSAAPVPAGLIEKGLAAEVRAVAAGATIVRDTPARRARGALPGG